MIIDWCEQRTITQIDCGISAYINISHEAESMAVSDKSRLLRNKYKNGIKL